MLNDFPTRALLPGLALAGLSAVAGIAQADTTPGTPSAQRNDGVMSFPNVRVEVAPPKAVVATAAAPSAAVSPGPGLVAAIDPATGRLVQPTAEDMAGLQPAPRRAVTTQSQRRAASVDAGTVYPAQGGVGQVLDSSFDSYMVVRRTADGKLEEVCAPGEQQALKALELKASKPKAATASKGELQ